MDLIDQIDSKVENLLAKLEKQEQVIADLQPRNEALKQNNQKTLDQIKEYIQELEQIRSYYVDSNNNNQQ
ncbi:MAG: hypothetical protein Tsb006_0240 [Rickettsiaceae bacterium]